MSQKFKIGGFVVYPSHGVGKLDSIETIDIDGEKLEFYIILFDKAKLTLKLPVKSAIESGLRPVIDKTTLQHVLSTLSIKVKKSKSMWGKRAQEYDAKLNSGDPLDLVVTVRELYNINGNTAKSFSERQIYQIALEKLATEMSIIENISVDDAIRVIESKLKEAA